MARTAQTWRSSTAPLARLQETPSVDQIADQLQTSLEKTDLIASTLLPIKSLHAPLVGYEEQTLEDTLADASSDEAVADSVWRDEIRSVIDRNLECLTPRERSVLSWRFGFLGNRPESLESIGRRLGLSRERIRQIEVRAFEKLQKKMRELAAEKNMIAAVNA